MPHIPPAPPTHPHSAAPNPDPAGPTLWKHRVFGVGERYLHVPGLEGGLYVVGERRVRLIDHFPKLFDRVDDPGEMREALDAFHAHPPRKDDVEAARELVAKDGGRAERPDPPVGPPASPRGREIIRIRRAMAPLIEAERPHPPLDETDVRLALLWLGDKHRPEHARVAGMSADEMKTWEERYRDARWHLARTLSARAAEKAARGFLAAVHGMPPERVEDVAARQLDEDGGREWKTHDLWIEGAPLPAVDVKNSRRAFHNSERYVEHYVRAKEYAPGLPVVALGVLSHYLKPSEILDAEREGRAPPLVLGESDRETRRALKAMTRRTRLTVDFKRAGEPDDLHFLPPWMFDYPAAAYRERDREMASLSDEVLLDPATWAKSGLHPAPVFLALGKDLRRLPGVSLTARQWRRHDWLRGLRRPQGFSLPAVHLSVLAWFAEDVAEGGEISPLHYVPLLFPEAGVPDGNDFLAHGRRWHTFPLGLYDPLRCIYTLLRSLDTLLRRAGEPVVRALRGFRLEGPNVLRATAGKREITVLSYCGGRNVTTRAACGETPLVLGLHRPCRRCTLLVCRKCLTCNENCEWTAKRRARLVPDGATWRKRFLWADLSAKDDA